MISKRVMIPLVVIMLCSVGMHAQETLPLHPGVGSEWYYDYASLSNPYGYEYGYSRVAIVKDTVVGDIPCLKTLTLFYNESGNLFDSKVGFVLYEGAKAYELYDGKKLLKYDLDAKEGEEVPLGFNYLKAPPKSHGILNTKVVVEKREMVNINGRELIRQHYKIDVRYATEKGEVVDTLRKSFTQLLGCDKRDNLQSICPWYDPSGDYEMMNSHDEKLRCFRSTTFDYKGKYAHNCDYVSHPVAVELVQETTPKLWIEGDKLLWRELTAQSVSIYDMSAILICKLSIRDGMSSANLDFLTKGESYLIVVEDGLGNRYAQTFLL